MCLSGWIPGLSAHQAVFFSNCAQRKSRDGSESTAAVILIASFRVDSKKSFFDCSSRHSTPPPPSEGCEECKCPSLSSGLQNFGRNVSLESELCGTRVRVRYCWRVESGQVESKLASLSIMGASWVSQVRSSRVGTSLSIQCNSSLPTLLPNP